MEHDALIAVAVALTPEFSPGEVTALFAHPGLIREFPEQQYDIAADGRRFVVVETLEPATDERPSIHVVLNWFAEFRDQRRE